MNADAPVQADDGFLRADGEAARLIRSFDWTSTPLGPPASWPLVLKTVVGVMLNSRHPMFLFWGPELIQIYNDAFTPSFGRGKHPAAMGQRGADCWQETWPIIWPQIDDVMSRRKPSWHQDQLVPIFRNDRIEDVFWSYGYSPVLEVDGTVAGTFVVCSETTSRVVAERRQRVIRGLSDALLAHPGPALPAAAVAVLREGVVDVPAILFYRSDRDDGERALVAGIGLQDEALTRSDLAIRHALAESPRARANIASGNPALLKSVLTLKGPDGPEPVSDAFVVPANGDDGAPGDSAVAYGLNPRIPFDVGYEEFLIQLTRSIVLAQSLARAQENRAVVEQERNNLLLQAPVPPHSSRDTTWCSSWRTRVIASSSAGRTSSESRSRKYSLNWRMPDTWTFCDRCSRRGSGSLAPKRSYKFGAREASSSRIYTCSSTSNPSGTARAWCMVSWRWEST